MATKICVRNLAWTTGEEDLRSLFARFGTVVSVSIPRELDTGKHRGLGFVEMESQDQALNSVDALNHSEFQSRSIIVEISRPQGDRGSFGTSITSRPPRIPRTGEPTSGGFSG